MRVFFLKKSLNVTWLTSYSCVRLHIVFYVHKFKHLNTYFLAHKTHSDFFVRNFRKR